MFISSLFFIIELTEEEYDTLYYSDEDNDYELIHSSSKDIHSQQELTNELIDNNKINNNHEIIYQPELILPNNDGIKWSCDVCTYENDSYLLNCSMCDSRK